MEENLRKLASVQTIKNIEPIEGADRIEKATIQGWQCVINKGSFKIGDKVVYIECDSFLPIEPQYEFLRKNCFRKNGDGSEGFRIKTCKLRGQLSQGVVFPLDILKGRKYKDDTRENPVYDFNEGKDVSALLRISKYEIALPACLAGQAKGLFPTHLVHKTDVERVQSNPKAIEEFTGKEVYIAVKVDGSSLTAYYSNKTFGVCSRNLELIEDDTNAFWKVVRAVNLKEKLEKYGRNIAVQAELLGPGCQKNRLGLPGLGMLVFDVFDIDTQRYLDFKDMQAVIKDLDLQMVPIDKVCMFDFTLEQLLEMAKGKYPNTNNNREGIVIRPTTNVYSHALKGRLSIKAINNEYLLEEK